MEEINFGSATELYQRLYPALLDKKREIDLLYKSDIRELDIWNYCKINIWSKTNNLALCDMVNDILNQDNDHIYRYIKETR